MRALLIGVMFLGLALGVVPARAVSPQGDFLSTFTKLDDARRLQRIGNLPTALLEYQECELELKKLRALYPKFEPDLLAARLTDCRAQIAILSGNPPPDSPAPDNTAPAANFASITSASDTGATAGTLEQRYLAIYLGMNDAERLERDGRLVQALAEFQNIYGDLERIRNERPDWESVLLMSRLSDTRAKIAELQPHVDAPALAASGFSPSDQTNILGFTLPPSSSANVTEYPWKTNILTTVFWIGGKSSEADPWTAMDQYGGPDGWQDMSGYAPAEHASLMNPFYVALPFNDLANPDLAKQWIPATWNKPPRDGKPVSACQGRWVEIKASNGRDCFAQWEDVGPGGTADAPYVFGTAPPAAPGHRGLDISPAVAKYLGIKAGGSATTDWRFVDDADVQPGMWLKYDEQAIIFRALHQQQEAEKAAQASPQPEHKTAPVARSKSSNKPAPAKIVETKAAPIPEPEKKSASKKERTPTPASTGDVP
jgi:hypothetical protein